MLGMEYCRAMLYERGHELQINEKGLFAKICNADCSFDILEAFIIVKELMHEELYMSFDEYYDVSNILSVIEKYQSGKLDKKYFTYWMGAYQCILSESFSDANDSEFHDRISLKQFIFHFICDLLDSLQFFDKDEVAEYFDFDKIKSELKCLDTLIRDEMHGRLKAAFAPHGSYCSEVVLLVTNDMDKYFVKLFGYLNFEQLKIEFKKVPYSALCNREKQLLQQGYKDLYELQ